ncbi:Carboxypeptidase Y homolog A [Seminavis robusta]|uniref:Carboxypeptidase n=1 Tax=Seminavis robusta TaxID=568900 RepID=A0A9N8DJK8_9STRA|nr:Carboxypeptidase Y homolog A [Seminavis robusta]|eukprot:Sro188_g081310.1 Carboxypeptidase Y homolog A (610) ;mRNA; f:82286-84469
MKLLGVLSSSLLLCCSPVSAAPLGDLVDYLPGYGRPPTPQFSGFLNATAGCDTATNGNGCYLHYWLALAEEDPWNKPTILWLNGGPGSSSILGFLQELGPLLMNATGGLMDNPYGWTKVANVFALEAPVGVGYSYCENQKKGTVCKNTDKFTASASRAAMVDFFQDKFPELGQNDFFIVGESYAGVYIPTLTKEILDHAAEQVPLKGIAVGDPCTDNTAQQDSMDSLWYGFKYGLVDEQTYDLLWNKCNVRSPNLMTQGGKHLVAAQLNAKLQAKKEELLLLLQDNNNDNVDIDKALRDHAEELWSDLKIVNRRRHNQPGHDETPECRLAQRKYLLSTSAGLSQGWSDLYIDDYSLFAPVSNKEDEDMATWMIRDDVRKALHVQDAPTKQWPHDDTIGFDYTKEYDACNNHFDEGAWSMINFYQDIVPRLKIAFVYNGDTDPCVTYEGTRTAIKRVGFPELDGGAYRPWFFNHTATTIELLAEKAPLFGPGLLVQDMGPQMAGHIVNYENNLSFLTFHGSGHMVPQFRPQSALHMVEKLVNYQDLSPLLAKNDTLTSMSDNDYGEYMNQWTESAQTAPFVKEAVWAPERRGTAAAAWESWSAVQASAKR